MFHSVITPSPVDCIKMFKLLSVVLALAVSVSCAPEIQSKVGLNTVAKQHRKLYFGTATNNEEFTNDTAYRNVIKDNRMFGQLTAANVMKWVRPPFTRNMHLMASSFHSGKYGTESRPVYLCRCRPIRAFCTAQ